LITSARRFDKTDVRQPESTAKCSSVQRSATASCLDGTFEGYGVVKESLKPQRIAGALLIIAGAIWSILFPKTADILRPDFVASVAIGIGLIIPGVVIFFSTKARGLTIVLATLLLWSLLLNAVLISQVKAMTAAMRSLVQTTEVKSHE
jgi:hypothetical protein